MHARPRDAFIGVVAEAFRLRLSLQFVHVFAGDECLAHKVAQVLVFPPCTGGVRHPREDEIAEVLVLPIEDPMPAGADVHERQGHDRVPTQATHAGAVLQAHRVARVHGAGGWRQHVLTGTGKEYTGRGLMQGELCK